MTTNVTVINKAINLKQLINPAKKKFQHTESNFTTSAHPGTIEKFYLQQLIVNNKDSPDIWVEDVMKHNEEDKILHKPRGK